MGTAAFIAGDWGTTHLRLALCESNGTVLDSLTGPGVSQIQGRFPETFAELTERWTRAGRRLPALLCGMVGSTIGWTNVPYVPCPTAPAQVAHAMADVAERSVFIVPGLSCRSRHDAPDVMRGEETQILGALSIASGLQTGQHLLCLPGTHTKWVVLENGVVREFQTSATGELFAIVNQHSVLIRGDDSQDTDPLETFRRAVDHVKRFPDAALAHLLFECRSRQVMGELSPGAAPHFLSGLLIAQDVIAARRLFADVLNREPTVTLVGTPHLMQLHSRALAAFDMPAVEIDGAQAVGAGLTSLFAHRFAKDRTDAA